MIFQIQALCFSSLFDIINILVRVDIRDFILQLNVLNRKQQYITSSY